MISHYIPNIILVIFGSGLYSEIGADIIECGLWERRLGVCEPPSRQKNLAKRTLNGVSDGNVRRSPYKQN